MLRLFGVCTAVVCAAALASACGDEVVQNEDGTAGTGAGGGGVGAGMSTTSSESTSSMGTGGGSTGSGQLPSECLADHHYPIPPDYDPSMPVMGSHCKGTNHQDITGIEKVVFVGDSIAQGTPPTPAAEFFRNVLADKLTAKFPGIEVEECAENGARMSDLGAQLAQCFPGVEDKVTLVVSVMGGNDISNWATSGLSQAEAEADADVVAQEFRDALATIQDDSKFPNGMFFIFSNVYEYTDGTAELDSCPTAGLIGLSGTYTAGATALAKLQEHYMQIAVDTQTDMILMGEEFCGHGYNRDVNNTCYLGPDAEQWFDISCIHPNPAGHNRIAELFELVIDE